MGRRDVRASPLLLLLLLRGRIEKELEKGEDKTRQEKKKTKEEKKRKEKKR